MKFKPIFSFWKPLKSARPKPKILPPIKKTFRPVLSQPVNLKKYPTRTKQETKLIDKSPWGDKDRDKVVNFFDCKPLNRKLQDVILYHGTTHVAAKQIRKEGLKVGHGINPVLYLTPHEATARKYAVGGPVFKAKLSDAAAKKHGIPLKNQPNQVTISEHIPAKKLKELKSLKSYPARTKQETRLIDENPFGDADGDKVPNIFDCKPLDKTKQGYRKITPIQRLKNLEELKNIEESPKLKESIIEKVEKREKEEEAELIKKIETEQKDF